MDLKCCPCTDELIAGGGSYPATDLPDAITMAPLALGGQQVVLPVCFKCRQKQLGHVSKNGLVTA